MSCGSNSTTHQSGRRPTSVIFKKTNKQQSEKHHISSSHAEVHRAISTKFCMVIEVVRAIISGPILFLGPIHSFAARGRRKFGWNRPNRSKLLIILSFIEIKQPYLAELRRLSARIKLVNFVKIVQGTRPLRAIIFVKFDFFSVLGAVNPHPWTDHGEIWHGGADLRSAPPHQIPPWSVQRVACGRKTPKSARE